jgi:DNA invertase Pin-like site-specific DNA recombinase
MSVLFDGFPLLPRRGLELLVLVIARISTTHQDPRSLADQVALCQKYVRDRYPGPVRFVVIQGQGSGELLDRKDLREAEAAVESRGFDLVVTEDLGRVCRRNRAVDFCELCEDADTRFLALNDSIDTAREDWRLGAFFASFKHESGNKDTAKRIRRSLRHRFEQGGVVQTFPYGYVKSPGAKAISDVTKDPAAEEVYEGWFALLEAGATYAEVADWLNARGVPTGGWAANERWDGRMVARVTHNPILKGFRRRNERKSRRRNGDGARRTVKAPAGERLLVEVPHLRFVDPARYDRLIAGLAARHAGCARGRVRRSPDGRAGVPKSRTVWPGQHVACGVCGRLYYWGGHGQTGRLMCAGARDHACWNGASFDGAAAGRRVAAAVLAAAEALPAFDDVFRGKVRAAAEARGSAQAERLRELAREVPAVAREVANAADSLARIGFSPALAARLAEAEARLAGLEAEGADLRARQPEVPDLPQADEVRARARAEVGRLDFRDPEFGRLMHQLVPSVEVFPFRLLGGGAVVLRARVTIDLAPLLGPAGADAGDAVRTVVWVDLFEPPQPVQFLGRVVALRAAGRTERDTAAALGLTVTAAQNAMALYRLMAAAGATGPYALLTAPPAGDGKMRRHAHPRYEFRPLEGYPRWSRRPTH